MIRNEKIDNFSVIAIILASLLSAFLLIFGQIEKNSYEDEAVGLSEADYRETDGITAEYTDRIFDDSYVHTINIVLKELNWDYMVEHASEEVYVPCDVYIDGDRVRNAAIRPKGNSSLESIEKQGDDHFSFKIEFDHYVTGNTYYGLDKLSLNNLGSDPTCMKDYFAYHMMNEMGVAAPLSAYALIQVNGEDFGLYLAVEAIDDSFCYRNYGDRYGELYKPDVYDINSIHLSDFTGQSDNSLFTDATKTVPGQRMDILGQVINLAFTGVKDRVAISAMSYVGDDIRDYSVIFDASNFNIDREDKERYVAAVRTLNTSAGSQQAVEALDLDQVMRYFVVHTFVNNYDSYNGVFVHNFYVHEKDGKLSLVPWDYNMAFGGFSLESAMYSFFGESKYEVTLDLGEGLSADESYVNYPIDTPMYVADNSERPMFGVWIEDEMYRRQYHGYYQDFLDDYMYSGKYSGEYEKVYGLIKPYIENGLTFYTGRQFEAAAETFDRYCRLRTESISGQLNGSIPTTIEGQEADPESLVDIGDLNLGKTIDFGGLAWGITRADVEAVMDAIAGDNEKTVEGLTDAIGDMTRNPETIPGTVLRAIRSSSLLKSMVDRYLMQGAALVLSVLLLVIMIKFARKYRRR